MEIPNKNDDFLVWFNYFTKLEYIPSYFFMNWMIWDKNNPLYKEENKYLEGWKTHIGIETHSEYVFVLKKILPILRLRGIQHKIVNASRIEEFNNLELQKGKILTIYDENLTFFQSLPDQVINFLFQEIDIKIATDKNIGGRVFVRYTGYYRDKVLNPYTFEYEHVPREEGNYKPLWMNEPPELSNLIKDEIKSA
jgi:hypothetical protein